MPHPPKDLHKISALLQIVADLRGPEGCPWDKEQTHQSLTPFAVEEVSELVEAIEAANDTQTKEELGDVLFQVALHAQLAKERGAFDFEAVVGTLNEKLVRRHPHVFSDVVAKNTEEVWKNWEALKKQEKALKAEGGAKPKVLDVPLPLPALQRAAKIGHRTNKLKFDWENPEQVLEKVREEFAELEEAIDEKSDKALRHEMGDVLFSLAQLSRHLGLDPEQCLREGNRRFENRFEVMMDIAGQKGLRWDDLSPDEKENLWGEAKLVTAKDE